MRVNNEFARVRNHLERRINLFATLSTVGVHVRIYTNVMLTVIALLLASISAKLYFFTPNQFGPSLVIPRQGDFLALRDLNDRDAQSKEAAKIVRALPVTIIRDGNVEVRGQVEVSGGNVTVDGEVEVSGGRISID